MLTGVHFIRFAAGLNLPPLPFSVPSWYFPLTGAFWGAIGLVTAFGLLRGLRWAPNLLRGVSVSYAGWFWLDRLLAVKAEYAEIRFLPAFLATLLGIGIAFFITQRPGTKSFFMEADQ